MNEEPQRRIRIRTWLAAAITLIVCCWLAHGVTKFIAIFDGLQVPLPVLTRIIVSAGPVPFLLYGIFAAAAILLTDGFARAKWLASVCLALFLVLAIFTFKGVVTGGVWMGPAHPTNEVSK